MVIPVPKPNDISLWVRYDGGQIFLNVPYKSSVRDLKSTIWHIFRSKALGGIYCGLVVPADSENLVFGTPKDDNWDAFDIVEEKTTGGSDVYLKDLKIGLKSGCQGFAGKYHYENIAQFKKWLLIQESSQVARERLQSCDTPSAGDRFEIRGRGW
ncbi:MAG: hypothetical protein M1814_006305 [Vezdaea aestivalis]|nr:MAG: hypothetical protein M1814_006305 [Vezdaea aestivalis]